MEELIISLGVNTENKFGLHSALAVHFERRYDYGEAMGHWKKACTYAKHPDNLEWSRRRANLCHKLQHYEFNQGYRRV